MPTSGLVWEGASSATHRLRAQTSGAYDMPLGDQKSIVPFLKLALRIHTTTLITCGWCCIVARTASV